MYCEDCQDKRVDSVDVKEKVCKVCGKVYHTRFTNICYECQNNGYCIYCGKKVKVKTKAKVNKK